MKTETECEIGFHSALLAVERIIDLETMKLVTSKMDKTKSTCPFCEDDAERLIRSGEWIRKIMHNDIDTRPKRMTSRRGKIALDKLVRLFSELDAELDGVNLPQSAAACANGIRSLLNEFKD